MSSELTPFWRSEKAFKDAVREATLAAEERVAGVHRRRLVTWAAAIAFLAATLVNIPVSEKIAHDNSHSNCVLITELAQLGRARVDKEQAGVEKAKVRAAKEAARLRRFERESPDRFGLTPAHFHTLIGEQRQERAEERADQAAAAAENDHRQQVLDRIATHNC